MYMASYTFLVQKFTLSLMPQELFKRETAHVATETPEGTGGVFNQ